MIDTVELLKQRSKRNEPLAKYTTSRIGGPADLLIEVRTVDELIAVVQRANELAMTCIVLGGGANVLVSDKGVRGLIILNRTKEIRFTIRDINARMEVDSGAVLATVARDCIERGLSGFEWAVGVPGTIGGAVVGNAGAHGSDTAATLYLAKVIRRGYPPEYWTPRQLAFGYRDSALKHYVPGERPIVLSALFDLKRDHRTNLERRASEYIAKRKATQPPGATIGSMFKNPPNDYAGRLIEAAGLKGTVHGGAMISPIHANFFVNVSGSAKARDVKALLDLARNKVLHEFGVQLEMEIELLGDWDADQQEIGSMPGSNPESA